MSGSLPSSRLTRQFLSQSLRLFFSGPTPPPETICLDAIDWPLYQQLADFHRIVPLLNYAIQTGRIANIPPDVCDWLAAQARSLTTQSLLQIHTLEKLVKTLEQRGIACIPFKGPALSALLYAEPGLRSSTDLDILVRETDFQAACQALTESGCTPAGEIDAYHSTFWFHAGGRKIGIELHMNLLPPHLEIDLDMAGIWQRRTTMKLGQSELFSLAPEDYLLFLCVHGSKHRWDHLHLPCDIARFLQRFPGLDWAVVLERAQKAGAKRAFLLGLAVADDFLGASLPPSIRAEITKDPLIPGLHEQVRKFIFEEPEKNFLWRAELIHFHTRLIDDRRTRFFTSIREWFNFVTIPEPSDLERFPLPQKLSFLYPFLRLALLLGRYSRMWYGRLVRL